MVLWSDIEIEHLTGFKEERVDFLSSRKHREEFCFPRQVDGLRSHVDIFPRPFDSIGCARRSADSRLQGAQQIGSDRGTNTPSIRGSISLQISRRNTARPHSARSFTILRFFHLAGLELIYATRVGSSVSERAGVVTGP